MSGSGSSAVPGEGEGVRGIVLVEGLLAGAVLGFEILLLRLLLVASYHHFVFLVLSVSLLGFGASGTFLGIFRKYVLGRGHEVLSVLCILSGLSMLGSVVVAQWIGVEGRLIPALVGWQVLKWVAYWVVLAVPFFVGAAGLGLGLMLAGRGIGGAYAANLVGSGVGAIGAPVLMGWVEPERGVYWWAAMAGGAGACVLGGRRGMRITAAVLAAVWLAMLAAGPGVRIRMEPYKYGSYLQRLCEQGTAQRLDVVHSARSMVELYRSDALHELAFLQGGAAPALDVVAVDGHWAGSFLRIGNLEEAEVLRELMAGLGYELVRQRPRVLLLGEVGGVNAWLAGVYGAEVIDWVQGDGGVIEILRRRGVEEGGAVFRVPGVRVWCWEPRWYVKQSGQEYELIHLVGLEGLAAGSAGMAGLAQDDLVTVEGLRECLGRLTEEGVLMMVRGIQMPPRDNVKYLATVVEALRRLGVEDAGSHVVMVRDFLAMCVLVRRTPWPDQRLEELRRLILRRQLTAVWYPGVREEELNQPDVLPAGPDGVGDIFSYAARMFFSGQGERLIREYVFDIRPARDDRPFFRDFFRLRGLGEVRRAYGDLWLTRLEMAYLFVLGSAAGVTMAGFVLVLMPLWWGGGRGGSGRWRGATALYFGALGLGYLMAEIAVLSRLTRFIGEPVWASAVTIGGFLMFSGLGAAAASRWRELGERRATAVVLLVVGCGVMVLWWLLGGLEEWVAVGSWAVRVAGAVLVVAVPAFLMGWPMPLGLSRLERAAPKLVPWAWGVNGFASVAASPAAMLIAMTWGYTAAIASAAGLYVAAGLVWLWWLKGRSDEDQLLRGSSGMT